MTVHCTSKGGKTSFSIRPKFNLELFKTLILNFAYIHSKRRKLGMFIFFQKYQFVYRNKINSGGGGGGGCGGGGGERGNMKCPESTGHLYLPLN